MKDRKGLFIGIAVIAVIIIAGIAAMAAGSNKNGTSSDSMANMPASSNSGAEKSTASTANAVATDKVSIASYKFDAETITVKAGTTVTWTNNDSVKHNVSPDKPTADFTAGELFGNGKSYSFTFKKAGTYKYHCDPHPYMHGTVVVTE